MQIPIYCGMSLLEIIGSSTGMIVHAPFPTPLGKLTCMNNLVVVRSYMYVCMYICMCIYYIYIYIYIYVCMYVCMYVYL